MQFAIRWFSLLLILWSFSKVSSVTYIDKVVYDYNSAVGKANLTYIHDASGNAVTNIFFETFVPVSKMLVYVNVKVADNKNNAGFYRDFLKTVVDSEKLMQGNQVNPIIKSYYDILKQSLDFEIKFPFPPVSFEKS